MLRKSTGYQVYPLTAGGNNQPNLPQGATTSFDFAAIQISTGRLPYYLLGIVLTLYGSVVQGASGSIIQPDALTAALVQSVEVRNTWMGVPLSQSYVLGSYLPLIEFVGCGYRLPRRESLATPAAAGTYGFARTIVLPLCIGQYPAPHHTAQLAAMYKTGQLVLNMQPASVLASISTGATVTGLSAQASTILDPHPALMLAPGLDWVDYQSTAAGTQQQIQLNAFGNAPTIKGTEPNAGVLSLFAIGNGTGTIPLPGSFDPEFINSYEFAWRSQFKTSHPEAVMAAQFLSLGGNSRNTNTGTSAAATAIDSNGFPYGNGSTGPVGPVTSSNKPMLEQIYGFPLVAPAEDVSLATVQTAQNTQSYNLGLSSGSFSGTNHTLAQHVYSWQSTTRDNWKTTVINSGLAGLVLGTTNVKLVQQGVGTRKQSRFQPWVMVAA